MGTAQCECRIVVRAELELVSLVYDRVRSKYGVAEIPKQLHHKEVQP